MDIKINQNLGDLTDSEKKELEEATSEVATYRNKADEVQAEAKEERAQLLKIVEDTQRLLEDANKEARKGVFRKLFGG